MPITKLYRESKDYGGLEEVIVLPEAGDPQQVQARFLHAKGRY